MSRFTVTPEFLNSLSNASIYAPDMSWVAAKNVYEEVEYLERQIILPVSAHNRPIQGTDYRDGSATIFDELKVFGEDSQPVLITAEHATNPYLLQPKDGSKPGYRGADHGTGGLAAFLARAHSQSIVPLGRQMSNVATAPDYHPLKKQMATKFAGKVGFLSLHGMSPGKLLDIDDVSEIHAVIGLGVHPNEQSRSVAESLLQQGHDLGLRLTIGNDTEYVIHDPETNGLKTDKEGNIKKGRLMAPRTEMTTNYAYRLMEKTEVQVPSFQLELTRSIRCIASDFDDTTKVMHNKRIMGVYLGSLLAQAAVQLVQGQK